MDIRSADLSLLVSLQALLETQNVTRAADQLGISQPALSAQLSRMRDIFSDPILVPGAHGRALVRTKWAEEVRTPLRLALKDLSEVVYGAQKFDPATSSRTFRILANDNAATLFAAHFARHFGQFDWPNLRLSIVASPADERQLAEMFESGAADLVLGSTTAIPAWANHMKLLETGFHLAQRRGHPRGSYAPTLAEYCGLSHVMVSGKGEFESFVDRQLAALGRTRSVFMSVQYYTVAPAIVAGSDMVCTLPSAFLKQYGKGIETFPLDFLPSTFGLHAAWHSRNEKDPSHRWLRKQMEDACFSH